MRWIPNSCCPLLLNSLWTSSLLTLLWKICTLPCIVRECVWIRKADYVHTVRYCAAQVRCCFVHLCCLVAAAIAAFALFCLAVGLPLHYTLLHNLFHYSVFFHGLQIGEHSRVVKMQLNFQVFFTSMLRVAWSFPCFQETLYFIWTNFVKLNATLASYVH